MTGTPLDLSKLQPAGTPLDLSQFKPVGTPLDLGQFKSIGSADFLNPSEDETKEQEAERFAQYKRTVDSGAEPDEALLKSAFPKLAAKERFALWNAEDLKGMGKAITEFPKKAGEAAYDIGFAAAENVDDIQKEFKENKERSGVIPAALKTGAATALGGGVAVGDVAGMGVNALGNALEFGLDGTGEMKAEIRRAGFGKTWEEKTRGIGEMLDSPAAMQAGRNVLGAMAPAGVLSKFQIPGKALNRVGEAMTSGALRAGLRGAGKVAGAMDNPVVKTAIAAKVAGPIGAAAMAASEAGVKVPVFSTLKTAFIDEGLKNSKILGRIAKLAGKEENLSQAAQRIIGQEMAQARAKLETLTGVPTAAKEARKIQQDIARYERLMAVAQKTERANAIGARIGETAGKALAQAGGAGLVGGTMGAASSGKGEEGFAPGFVMGAVGSIPLLPKMIRTADVGISGDRLAERGSKIKYGDDSDAMHEFGSKGLDQEGQRAINIARAFASGVEFGGKPVKILAVSPADYRKALGGQQGSEISRGAWLSQDGTIYINAGSKGNAQQGGVAGAVGHEAGHVFEAAQDAMKLLGFAKAHEAIRNRLLPGGQPTQEFLDAKRSYEDAIGKQITQEEAISEILAETQRGILNDEPLESFALPKPVLETIQDAIGGVWEKAGLSGLRQEGDFQTPVFDESKRAIRQGLREVADLRDTSGQDAPQIDRYAVPEAQQAAPAPEATQPQASAPVANPAREQTILDMMRAFRWTRQQAEEALTKAEKTAAERGMEAPQSRQVGPVVVTPSGVPQGSATPAPLPAPTVPMKPRGGRSKKQDVDWAAVISPTGLRIHEGRHLDKNTGGIEYRAHGYLTGQKIDRTGAQGALYSSILEGARPGSDEVVQAIERAIPNGEQITLDYDSAPFDEGGSTATAFQRRKSQEQADKGEIQRVRAAKTFIPQSLEVTLGEDGAPKMLLMGYSPDKMRANAKLIGEGLQNLSKLDQNMTRVLDYLNDPAQWMRDQATRAENMRQGYRGDGSGPFVRAKRIQNRVSDIPESPKANPDYMPVKLEGWKTDVLNLLEGGPSATYTPESVLNQKPQQNQLMSILKGMGERFYVEENGTKVKGLAQILNPAQERLRLDRVHPESVLTGTSDIPASRYDQRAAAFLPEAKSNQEEERARPVDGFYSELENQILKIKQEKFSPEQLRGMLNGKVKAEEMKWVGEPALKALAGKKSVTKQEVLDSVRANAVKFEDKTLGSLDALFGRAQNQAQQEGYTPQEFSKAWGRLSNATDKEIVYSELGRLGEIIRPAHNAKGSSGKFEGYQLPGGENYREVVVNLPGKNNQPTIQRDRKRLELLDHSGAVVARLNPSMTDAQALQYYAENFKSVDDTGKTYRSSHYPEGDYLMHMRLNDRQDSSGRKGTFIEEIQSDRHQQARDKGYMGEGKPRYRVVSDDVMPEMWLVKDENGNTVNFGTTQQEAQKWADAYDKENFGKIPDAPYRKDWSVQMFKRALRDAVESGHEWIGWTDGKTQADRYKLSRQIEEVRATPIGENFRIFAKVKNGTHNLDELVKRENLSDVVGKELAKKIIEDNGGEYKGLDLDIGGDGMKGFYDKILPKEVQDYVKKMGGSVSQGEIDIRTPESEAWYQEPKDEHFSKIWKVEITPEMRKSVSEKGQPLFLPEKKEPALKKFGKRALEGKKAGALSKISKGKLGDENEPMTTIEEIEELLQQSNKGGEKTDRNRHAKTLQAVESQLPSDFWENTKKVLDGFKTTKLFSPERKKLEYLVAFGLPSIFQKKAQEMGYKKINFAQYVNWKMEEEGYKFDPGY